MPKDGQERHHKDWRQHAKDELKGDIEAAYESAPEGEYYALIIKVDPEHNPISGYHVVTSPLVKAPPSP